MWWCRFIYNLQTRACSLLAGWFGRAVVVVLPFGRRGRVRLFLRPQLERSTVYPGAGGRMANSWDESAVRELSRLPTVDRAFGLGSVLAVEMKTAERG